MPTLRDFTLLDPRAMLDTDFYDNLRAGKPRHKLIDRFIIPPYEGRGFIVKRGQSFRIIEEEGVQIADVSFWNANNPNPKTVYRGPLRVRFDPRQWQGIGLPSQYVYIPAPATPHLCIEIITWKVRGRIIATTSAVCAA